MSERLKTIVEAMDIQPNDVVLEIGCGHGVAVAYICAKLGSGHLVAIDKSMKMIDVATRRNREHVRSGKAALLVSDARDFDPGPLRFDKILAVRVGMLHRDAGEARARIESWLKPGGHLFLHYDEPKQGE